MLGTLLSWVPCFVIKRKYFRKPSALSEYVSKQEKKNRNNTCPLGLMAEYGIVLLDTRHGSRRHQSQTERQNSVKCWLRGSPVCFRLLQCSFEELMEKDIRSIIIPCLGNSLYDNVCTNGKKTLRLSLPGYTTFAFQEENSPKP